MPSGVIVPARSALQDDPQPPAGRPLSKSRLNAFLQCEKRLWLEVHRPDLRAESVAMELAFAGGNEVGARARAEYPDGILIGPDANLAAALCATEQELARTPKRTLFEATFRAERVLVRADLLVPEGSGYGMIEVKSTARVRDYHVPDAAVQTWVARRAGTAISSTAVRHVDTRFVYPGDGDYAGLFTTAAIDDAVEPLQAEVPQWIRDARSVLDGKEPDIRTGPHCGKPFDCPFQGYCSGQEPPAPAYPVTLLPARKGKALAAKLVAEGYASLAEVPAPRLAEYPLLARVHAATMENRPYLDAAGARAAIRSWGYPLYYLDFETIGFAVPRWPGTRPYQQIPFQWSCHVDHGRGRIEHREFVDVTGQNPVRECAEQLLSALDGKGAIIAYNANFEKQALRTLADMLPDLRRPLLAIRARVVDLLPIVREHYYHRDMMGSFSIKAVLPTIAPELDYADLGEVQDGTGAQQAYLEASAPGADPARKADLEAKLKAYCARDTEAMVEVARALTA